MFDLVNLIITVFLVLAPPLYLFLVLRHFSKYLKENWVVILAFFVFTAVFFNKLLFFGKTLSQQDFNNIQVTFAGFYRESIVSHYTLPLWNTRFGGGFDAFSNPLSPYFSPFSFIFLFDPGIYTAFNIFIFLQVLFILVFSFIALKGFGFNRGGLVFWVQSFTLLTGF